MSKVRKIDISQDARTVVEKTAKSNSPEIKVNYLKSDINRIGTDQSGKPTTHLPFLRERIEAIQKIKEDHRIISEAATLFGLEYLIPFLILWGIKVIAKRVSKWFREKDLQYKVDAAMKHIQDNWPELSSFVERERMEAADKFRRTHFENPKQVIDDIYSGLVAIYDHSIPPTNEDIAMQKQLTRAFLAALEGLYQRDEENVEITYEVREKFRQMLKEKKVSVVEYPSSEECIRRILVLNWKVPINEKIPVIDMDRHCREDIYETFRRTLVDPHTEKPTQNDPLFLRTPEERIPSIPKNLRHQAQELKDALVLAYNNEIKWCDDNEPNSSLDVANKIKAVLIHTVIPMDKYDAGANEQRLLEEKNKKRLSVFKEWTGSKFFFQTTQGGFQMTESDLEACFKHLDPEQKVKLGPLDEDTDRPKDVSKFQELLLCKERPRYSSEEDLNKELKLALDFIKLDEEIRTRRLTSEKEAKGLFFFKFLNLLLDMQVTIGDNPLCHFRNHLNIENRDRVLNICFPVVHDRVNFPSPNRTPDFFMYPPSNSLPGEALALFHKINDPSYRDTCGLRDIVLPNAVSTLAGETKKRGYLISGPQETDKLLFAKALANQLAVNFFEINKELVHSEKSLQGGYNVTVKLPDETKGTIEDFVNYVAFHAPCVVFFGDAEKILVPRKAGDPGRDLTREPTEKEENLTLAFLTPLQNLHNITRGVILIMATDMPPTKDIKIDSLDETGYSHKARRVLWRYVASGATNSDRVDNMTFLLHKLKSKTGSETGTKKNASDEQVLTYLQNKVSAMVQRGKKLSTSELDFDEMLVFSEGLTPEQIRKALEDLTPFELTQENILAAFEEVKKEN